MSLSQLPTEIISQITSYLPRSSKLYASLVCRKWHTVFLSTLYHSISLTKDSHITHFARAITSGGVLGLPLHISQSVRSLSLSWSIENKITEAGLAPLESCIACLVQLRRFDYSLCFTPDNSEVLRLLQTQCPRLESLSLSILGFGSGTEAELSKYAALFSFRNLVDISLMMDYIVPNLDTRNLAPLNNLVANSPRLESLEVALYLEGDRSYSLDHLAISLGKDLTLPSLHTLHLPGDTHLDKDSLFGPPTMGPHDFRNFLSRHPRIKDLELGCSLASGWLGDPEIDSEILGRVLPSLRRLRAPVYVCAPLMYSSVAAHIETLVIRDDIFEPKEPFTVPAMPMLRELTIDYDCFDNALDILKLLLPAATGLQVLRLSTVPDRSHTEFFELLEYTPNLQKVGIGHSSSNELMEKIKATYPRVEIVRRGLWEDDDE